MESHGEPGMEAGWQLLFINVALMIMAWMGEGMGALKV